MKKEEKTNRCARKYANSYNDSLSFFQKNEYSKKCRFATDIYLVEPFIVAQGQKQYLV